MTPFLAEALAITAGAVVAAYFGAAWLKRLSPRALSRWIFALLLILGCGMVAHAQVQFSSDGFLPSTIWIRVAAGLLLGIAIGAISSVLGVAGGEVIIPTLVFGYGSPIKVAGSLSLLISLPTVLTGIVRHTSNDAYSDREVVKRIVVPMGLGSVLGGLIGGFLGVRKTAFAVGRS